MMLMNVERMPSPQVMTTGELLKHSCIVRRIVACNVPNQQESDIPTTTSN